MILVMKLTAQQKQDLVDTRNRWLAIGRSTQPIVITVDAIDIELAAGEVYAGSVLGADGDVKHHLVLLAARPDDDLDWEGAKAWALTVYGALPDRQEAALLYTNCKAHIDARWHWTSDPHKANASYAWGCHFGDGGRISSRVSSTGAACAVRRLQPLSLRRNES